MQKSKQLYGSFDELRPYGVESLTGEACAYAMRILCDLNEDGVKLMTAFFGNTLTFTEGSNWNRFVNNKPAVASVMLTRAILPDLCRFILFHVENFRYVVAWDGYSGTMIAFNEREELDRYQNLTGVQIWNNLAYSSQPNTGGRNIHAFTGRSV